MRCVWSEAITTAKGTELVFFPPDRQLGLGETAFSSELARQKVWVGSLLPYEQAAQVFQRIGKRRVGATSIWEQVQRHGPQLQAYSEYQQEQVSIERVVLPGYDLDVRKGIRLNGGMVHIREEGWKEFKVGTVRGYSAGAGQRHR